MRWLLLTAAQVDPKLVEPSIGVLEKTVLGSLLLLSWALGILAVVQLIRVQNARVSDQKAMNDKSEKLMGKMITAFSEMKGALEGLKKAEEEGQKVTEAVHTAITNMSSRMDMLVFSIGGKRFTPTSTKSPRAKDPDSR
jgi:hypothetical protein